MGLLLSAVQIYFCPSRRTASIAQDSISGDQMSLGGNSYGPQFPGVLGGYLLGFRPLGAMGGCGKLG